jgi:hypothetical protein
MNHSLLKLQQQHMNHSLMKLQRDMNHSLMKPISLTFLSYHARITEGHY